MYAFSPVVGWLVDRTGRVPMILVGAGILAVSCVVCALAPADSVPILEVGLFLLGLGWSFTLIAGSTLLTGDVGENERRGAGPVRPRDEPRRGGGRGGGGGAVAGVIVATSTLYRPLPRRARVLAIPLSTLWLTRAARRGAASP
jgi:MFS family permease